MSILTALMCLITVQSYHLLSVTLSCLWFIFQGSLPGSNRQLLSSHQVGAAHLWEERLSWRWGSALHGANQRPAAPRAAVLRPGRPCGPRGPEDWQASLQLPEELWSLQVFHKILCGYRHMGSIFKHRSKLKLWINWLKVSFDDPTDDDLIEK